jgi:3-keto-L-gulonate-6-phosphate decarboxylase
MWSVFWKPRGAKKAFFNGRPMATLLQLVLDEPDRGSAIEVARQLADLVDALELGPQLLRAEGPHFVTTMRDTAPDRPLICWAESEAEADALMTVGVEGLTIPATASDEALSAIITRAREAGTRLLLDLLSISDPVAHEARFKRLKPDLLKVPMDVNIREALAGLRKLEIPLAFSGDWSVAQVPWLLLYRPVALITGPAVAAAPEARRIVEAIRARMAVTPMMSRFY